MWARSFGILVILTLLTAGKSTRISKVEGDSKLSNSLALWLSSTITDRLLAIALLD